MPDATVTPVTVADNENYRYTRTRWISAGIDNYVTAPAQNADSLEVATNVLSPLTNSWLRRYGYRSFTPSLDQGIGTSGDQVGYDILYGTGFDGVSGYVSTPNEINVTADSNLSIEFWFETNNASGGYLVSLESNATVNAGDVSNLAVILNTTGTLALYYYSSGAATLSLTTSASYNDGLPHYVVVTLAGAVATIYVDNVVAATSTLAAGIGTISDYYWRFAEGPTGGGAGRTFPAVTYLQTFLSHVSVYPYALTATQIGAHYTAATAGSQALYETAVKTDSPSDFWYLNETMRAVPPGTALVVQQASSIVNAASTTVAFGSNTTLGNTILVLVGTDNSVTPSVSDGLNTYTAITHTSKLHSFYAPITSPAATTITVSGSGTQNLLVLAFEIYGGTGSLIDQAANSSQGTPTTSYTSPSITTTETPDVVWSVVYSASRSAGFSTSLTAGNGFALANSVFGGGAGVDAGYTVFLLVAYAAANTTGAYSGSWSSTATGTYQGLTFGFNINAVPAATGTTAFDYVFTDNGTYLGTYFLSESTVI